MQIAACPSRRTIKALLEGSVAPEREFALAAHLGECAACRMLLASVAAGDRPSCSWTDRFRGPRVPIGPVMQEMLDSIGVSRSDVAAHRKDLPEKQVDHLTSRGEIEVPNRFGIGSKPRPWPGESLPFLEPPDGPDCIGRLGPYRVLKLLGRGGMGVVYQARDPVLGRLVAIKALAPQLCGDAAAQARFLREARAAAAINHPNVVTIYAVEEVAGLLLLVMELVDGVSLQDRIAGGSRLALPEIVRIGAQVAAGLAAAHARGLVHRDIKPANILLAGPSGQAKITDFGLARAADDAVLTLSGVVVGTPAYMAPEQARGQPAGHRADLFSLGSVLYAMSAGSPPYSGSTLAVLRAVAAGPPVALQAMGTSVPQWLIDLIAKLHAPDPARRFQTAAEVAEVLRQQWESLRKSCGALSGGLLSEPALPPGAPSRADLGDNSAGVIASLVPTPPPPPARSQVVGPPRLRPLPASGLGRTKRLLMLVFLGLSCLVILLLLRGPRHGNRAAEPSASSARSDRPSASEQRTEISGSQPFVLIRADGTQQQAFAQLEAAVREARSGDVVEIRGKEPRRLAPIHLHGKSLTLRAAPQSRPVLQVPSTTEPTETPVIQTESSLLLEGLDFECLPAPNQYVPPSLLLAQRGSVRLINCRMIHGGAGPAVRLDGLTECEIRNCVMYATSSSSVDCFASRRIHVLAQNDIFSGFSGITIHQAGQDATEATLALHRNTMVLHEALRLHMDGGGFARAKGGNWSSLVHIEGRRNLIDTDRSLLTFQADWTTPEEVERQGRIMRAVTDGTSNPTLRKLLNSRTHAALAGLKKIVTWRSEQDIYCGSGPLMALASSQNPQKTAGVLAPGTLAEWSEYWGMAQPGMSRLTEGSFDGRSLRAKAAADPRSMSGADYCRKFPNLGPWRRPAEAKLEGARTTIVGPGDSLEAWKNTVDYRTWTETIRQRVQ